MNVPQVGLASKANNDAEEKEATLGSARICHKRRQSKKSKCMKEKSRFAT